MSKGGVAIFTKRVYDPGEHAGYDAGEHAGYDPGEHAGYDPGEHQLISVLGNVSISKYIEIDATPNNALF